MPYGVVVAWVAGVVETGFIDKTTSEDYRFNMVHINQNGIICFRLVAKK